MTILESANEPIVAASIAARLYLSGSRETQRRHVRALVKQLRENGSMIVATLQGGYFLTDDEKIWQDYLAGRQIDAKKLIGLTHSQIKMLRDNRGQGLLFNNRIQCGVATVGV